MDSDMRAILNEPGLTSYEKIKKYDALLQRYLTLLKQGVKEEQRVSLTLHRDTSNEAPEHERSRENQTPGQDHPPSDQVVMDVLKSMPKHNRKNAEYILKKLSERSESWTSLGEFVYKGNVVKGSHMIDLLKNLMLPFKKSGAPLPRGWSDFLHTLSEVNIPISSVNNPYARDEYRRFKTEGEGASIENAKSPPSVKQRRRRRRGQITLSPHWSRSELGKNADGEPKKSLRKTTLPPRWITFSP